jgi:hypothetical protein
MLERWVEERSMMPVTEPSTAPQDQETLAVPGGVADVHASERRLAP